MGSSKHLSKLLDRALSHPCAGDFRARTSENLEDLPDLDNAIWLIEWIWNSASLQGLHDSSLLLQLQPGRLVPSSAELCLSLHCQLRVPFDTIRRTGQLRLPGTRKRSQARKHGESNSFPKHSSPQCLGDDPPKCTPICDEQGPITWGCVPSSKRSILPAKCMHSTLSTAEPVTKNTLLAWAAEPCLTRAGT